MDPNRKLFLIALTTALFRLAAAPYHGTRWDRSWARFLWRDTDEALWVACDMTGCCRSSGADIY